MDERPPLEYTRWNTTPTVSDDPTAQYRREFGVGDLVIFSPLVMVSLPEFAQLQVSRSNPLLVIEINDESDTLVSWTEAIDNSHTTEVREATVYVVATIRLSDGRVARVTGSQRFFIPHQCDD